MMITKTLFSAILCFAFLLCTPFLIHSQEIQNASNTWYFGDKAGLNFNTNPPTALTDGEIDTQEGVATISNSLGALLFYTDGITVWDRTHQPMPNANGTLNGHASSTQSALIVPHPGNSDLYYIFTTDELAGGNGFSYSIVDISLPGNGSVASPSGNALTSQLNIQLVTPVAEKIAGILKPDGSGYWIIAHGWNNNRFYAFEISCDGINPVPVTSDVGNIHGGGANNINSVGYMKSSVDGQKLALVNRNTNSVDVYDFDNVLGTVSNEVEITPNDNITYGIEFSPSGDYLYIGGTDIISRYTFSSGDLTDITIDNTAPFSNFNGVRALQLGPDENIYVSIRNWDYISIIYNPDGNNPVLTTNGIYLNPDNLGRNCRFGLPNIFYFDLSPADSLTIATCPFDPVEYNGEIYQPGTVNEVHFLNIQGCDSTVILSVEELLIIEQTIAFDECEGSFQEFNGVQIPAGSQEVFTFTNDNGCDSIITVIVNIVDIIEEDIIEALCEGETYVYNGEVYAAGTDTIFQWIDQNGCENITTLILTPSPELTFELMPDNACWDMDNGSITVQNIEGGIPPFEFSLDSQNYFTDSIIDNLAPNIYNLQIIDANQCDYYQEVEISVTPEFDIDYAETILSCEDDSVLVRINLLNINENEVVWKWSNGAENSFIYASQPGLYQLEVSNKCQILTEEINVGLEEDLRERFIFIPNVFSPNFDGTNDVFQLFPADDVEILNFEIQIFNRWGAQVFASKDINSSWDGIFKGKEMNTGVYVWWLKINLLACKREISIFEQGDITIVR